MVVDIRIILTYWYDHVMFLPGYSSFKRFSNGRVQKQLVRGPLSQDNCRASDSWYDLSAISIKVTLLPFLNFLILVGVLVVGATFFSNG